MEMWLPDGGAGELPSFGWGAVEVGAQWRLGPFRRAALSSVVVCGLGLVDVGGCGAVEVGARWGLRRCGDVSS